MNDTEQERINKRLAEPLDPAKIRTREGPSRKKIQYLSGADVAGALNDALGATGWGRRIEDLTMIHHEARPSPDGKRQVWDVLARAT